ncbi:hypothetical protein BGX21_010042 [Mortierella sp. AD011]|nr:hypothetical protein BGX20_010014 [Mortierella sp. AD010]KAF9395184.1 hypothetical protein BGX21_010042 [Mortierella sp. AD011]
MTVRSPVLTSTSSGMGTLSDMSSSSSSSSSSSMSPSTLQPVQTDAKLRETKLEVRKDQEDQEGQGDMWGTRSCLTEMLGDDRSRILIGDIDQGDLLNDQLSTEMEVKVKIKREPSEGDMDGLLYDDASSDASLTGTLKSETRNNRQQRDSVNKSVSILKGNGKEEEDATCHMPPLSSTPALAASAVESKMRSTSRVSSFEDTSSRSPSMFLSPSTSQSSQSFIQEHVTAHDISLMTASFGALTPQEIQSRFYAQREQQQRRQKSRRLSRRKTIIKNMNGQQQQQQLLSAPNNTSTTAVEEEEE